MKKIPAWILVSVFIACFLKVAVVQASLVTHSTIEEVAEKIDTIIKVRVTDVKQTPVHMTLKNGQEGPIIRYEVDIKTEILSVLFGEVQRKDLTVRYNIPVLAKYDEEGQVELTYSLKIPGSALEYEIQPGQEYIFCFSPQLVEDLASGTVYLLRAEKSENEKQVLDAVNQARKNRRQ